jgi:2-hydroxy-5-methyl-1-naphthoate 7-hydroxylase
VNAHLASLAEAVRTPDTRLEPLVETTAQDGPFVLDPTGRDIHGEAARIRARGPATRIHLPGGVEAWGVTDLSLLRQLLTDSRVSKDPRRHWPPWINGELSPAWPLYVWLAVNNMLTAYGDRHRRLRRLISSAFTVRRTATLRPRIEKIATELLDGLEAAPSGLPVDLREEYAYPLPIAVICELFGIDDDTARDEMRQCVYTFFNTSAEPDEVAAAYPRLQELLGDLIAEKRKNPDDDLSSALIAARDEGSGLSEEELLSTLVLFVSAGHETTVNLLDNAIYALLTRPDQLALVRAGRAGWDDVVEETLRAEAPIANLPCVSPSRTSPSTTASPSTRATRSSAATPPPDVTRSCTATPRTASTSPAPTRSTSPSATASTTASARPLPGLRAPSRCPRSSIAFPA